MKDFKTSIIEQVPGIEFSDAPASKSTLQEAQKVLNCEFGSQLESYLTEFGYLSFGYFEMYGINERQKMSSDMIKATVMLHSDFSLTLGLVAIENQGDGDYFLCDSRNMIYEFIPSDKMELIPMNMNLHEYIIAHSKE